MQEADIVKIAIESGLKLNIKNKKNKTDNKIIERFIPDRTFGVFVSVERSKYHKLKSWPEDIHGCIGYWDKEYNQLDNQTIINKIKEVAYSATWQDERRFYFKSIYLDIYAKYKIYFMLQDVFKINNETGTIENTNEIFNNSKYGLIVESQGHHATYLPDVFPDEPWSNIKRSLLNKADIGNIRQVNFYGYRAHIVSKSLFDYLILPVKATIEKIYKDFIPYELVNNKVIVDVHQDVRNLGTIYDILKMEDYGYQLNNQVKQKMVNNVEYYVNKYQQNKDSNMKQASIFLLLNLDKLKIHLDVQETIVRDLLQNLDKMEEDFELGEAIYALSTIGKIDKDNNIFEKIYSSKKVYEPTKNDIFRYNWHTKCLRLFKTDYVKYLAESIKKIVSEFTDNEETNYYAVALEAMTSFYKYINSEAYDDFDKLIEKMIILLNNRKRDGLYEFTNKTIRLDITGHVLNCYYNLAERSKLLEERLTEGGSRSNNKFYEKYRKYKKKYLTLTQKLI